MENHKSQWFIGENELDIGRGRHIRKECCVSIERH